MVENFLSLGKETTIRIKAAQGVPNNMNQKGFIPRYIIIKMTKLKECFIKAAREKQIVMFKRTPIRPLTDFKQKPFKQERMGGYIQIK